MGLHYPENSGIMGYSDESWKDYIKEQLNLRVERLKNKQHEINELMYEKELVEDDIIDVIKTNAHNSKCGLFWGVRDSIFTDACQYFWHRNDVDFDEQEKDRLKTPYEYVINTLKEKFFKDYDVELVEVLEFWYGVGYEFIYKYKGKRIQLEVPCYSMANKENYVYLLNGYKVLYEEEKSHWKLITSSIDYQDIIEPLHKWMDENGK